MVTQSDNTILWIADAAPSGGKLPLTRKQLQIDCSRQRIKTLAEERVVGEYPNYGKEFQKVDTSEWNEDKNTISLISPICNYISTVPPKFERSELSQLAWVPVEIMTRAGIGTSDEERLKTLEERDSIVYFKLPDVIPNNFYVSSWLATAPKGKISGVSPTFQKVEVNCSNNQIRALGAQVGSEGNSDTSE